MKNILLVVTLALSLVMLMGAEKPVVASSEFPSAQETPNTQTIRALKRASTENKAGAVIRDPFALPNQAPMPTDQSTAFNAPTQVNRAPSLPAFQILGKQEDDEGWAVFISTPDKPGQVWVVREGEAFNENFRVSKLAPPLLIIKSTRSSQSQTFNIGKDEE